MGRTPRNTAPIAGAASTFAYSSQDLSSALHTLHARSNKGDNNFEIIAVASSIAGVVVAILGLILGYIYWKRGPRNTSPASIQLEPLSSDNSPNPRTDTSPNPSTLNSCPTIPVNPSPDTSPTPVSVNISFNYNGTSLPFPYALDPSNPPMLCVEGSRTVTAPIEPAVRDGGGPSAKVEAITV